MKKIPYGRQSITEEDKKAVLSALGSAYLTTGPKVKEFEEEFAAYIGCHYAVAVNSGTSALHLSAKCLLDDSNAKVITSPISFSASANCVLYEGREVAFCDVDPKTGLIDLDLLDQMISNSCRGSFQGVIPVDYAGYPVDLEKLKHIAERNNLWILEDSCHAPGASFVDTSGTLQMCGNGYFADLAIFSFHPVKHITTGEGGMITTNNASLYKRLIRLRSHGMLYQGEDFIYNNEGGWYMEMIELGYNYRMPDILCALGLSQLSRINAILNKRKKIAYKYDSAFKNSPVNTISVDTNANHAYHLYVILVNNRKELYYKLKERNIYTQVHYIPIYNMPYYRKKLKKAIHLPGAESFYQRCLSLPLFPDLTESEQDYVIENVLKYAR